MTSLIRRVFRSPYLQLTHIVLKRVPFDEQIILKKRNTAFVLPRLLSASSKNEKTIASSEDVESKIKRLEFRCIE